jgi:hypothetical protein
MKPLSVALTVVAIATILAPVAANAQQSGTAKTPQMGTARSVYFDLPSGLTKDEFADLAAELGSLLRFRQVGDSVTLGRGKFDIGTQFATTPIEGARETLNVVGRLGVSDRVDVGAWGGYNTGLNYGLVGGEARIALLREGSSSPVSLLLRPSVTSLVGPSEVWAATASIDFSVSRAFGSVTPYAGVATTGTLALERSNDVSLDPATANGNAAYAGLSYRWRSVAVSAEVEKAAHVSYAFRLGTRF